ncbi:Mss4-like protein [Colletotrichum lupini]|nr:Mss4-like protein [Colletotrichum lupini]
MPATTEIKRWGKADLDAFLGSLPTEVDTSTQYPGSCLCGGVRFYLAGEPLKKVFCYCDHCRKNSGGTGQQYIIYQAEDMTIDDPKGYKTVYTIPGDTVTLFPKEKYFCSQCACTLIVMPLMLERKLAFVPTGLMNHGLDYFKPDFEYFADKRPAFLAPIPGAGSYKVQAGEHVPLDDTSVQSSK